MSFDTSWDVDKYRTDHESEEHWQLRRRFMVAHQNKIPEERLVCLTQVFSNIELLGCRYPLEIMQLVEQLSEGIADDYREKKFNNLQRTFVKASDEACTKVKGLKRPAPEDSTPMNSPPKIHKRIENPETSERPPERSVRLMVTSKSYSSEGPPERSVRLMVTSKLDSSEGLPERSVRLVVTSKPDSSESTDFSPSSSVSQNRKGLVSKGIKFVRSDKTPEMLVKNVEDKNHVENKINGYEPESSDKRFQNCDKMILKKEVKNLSCGPEDNAATVEFRETYEEYIKKIEENVKKIDTKKFGKLILVYLVEPMDPLTILNRSCTLCSVPFIISCGTENGSMFCRVYVNEQLVVSVFDAVKETAKEVAVHCTLKKLRDVCYSLTIKKLRVHEDYVVDMDTINSITCQEEMRAPVARAMTCSTPLPEDNVGSRLMRSMGWAGGGLGKAEQGIQEPVSVSFKLNRAGLGNKKGSHVSKEPKYIMNAGVFKSKVQIYLTEYMMKDLTLNLNFPHSEFSAPELTFIHQLAKSLGLQCSSNRKSIERRSIDRRLIISKQETIELIVARMLYFGIYSDEYSELKEPQNKKLLDNFEPETLMASDFPQLCPKKNDSQSSLNSDNVCGITDKHGLIEVLSKMKRPEVIKMKTKSFTTYFKKKKLQKKYCLEAIAAGPYGCFFLIEHANSQDSPWSILNFSAMQNGVPIRIDRVQVEKSEAESWSCKLFVNGHLLTSCYGENEIVAQEKAKDEAYEKLKQICYILKVKSGFVPDDPVLGEPDNFEKKVTSERNSDNALGKQLGDEVDSKFMQAMECTGGGCGQEKQGIEEPICVAQRVYRKSIDVGPCSNIAKKKGKNKGLALFRKKVHPILEKYAKDGSSHSIIFSSDFSKQERIALHRMAPKLSLKSKSYGDPGNRSVVVSKMINYCQVVEEMLRTGEYSSPLYELIKPPISLSPTSLSLPDHESNANCGDLSEADSMNLDKQAKVSSVCNPVKVETSKVEEISFKNEDSSVEKNTNINVVIVNYHEKNIKKLRPQQHNDNDKTAEPYGPLILLENKSFQPLQIIERSANAFHVPFKLEYCKIKGGVVCRLYVNNALVASNFDSGKKKARDLTVNYGLKKLKDVCYSLKSEMKLEGNRLKTIKILVKPNSLKSSDSSLDSEIICHSKHLDWLSLGLESRENVSEADFISGVHDYLRKYRLEINPYDVVVSPDFTAQELAKILKIASTLGLKLAKQRFAQKDFQIIYKKLSILQITQAFLNNEENLSSNSVDKANAVVILDE